MIIDVLQPTIPFYDDEVTQGYFARIGHFQAGVDAGHFCRFFNLERTDFRDGHERCIEVIAALSGKETDLLRLNAIRPVSDGALTLRGEVLGLQVIRRITAKFCPRCLTADEDAAPYLGKGAWRFRWSWLLKPVVGCPVHNTALVSLPAKDPVNAFDLRKLFAQHDVDLASTEVFEHVLPGSLQRYVVSRIADRATASPWLDSQGVAEGVRACEMVGSLICDGPTAEIKSYTDMDWARVGNVGFNVCCHGPEAILEALSKVRLSGGHRSGRAGPQATFGQLFNWLKKSDRVGKEGPIRDVVRDAIVENFPIGSGEMVLGQAVGQRKVHSVNSLTNATGLNRFRLYRVMRKTGMIPEDIYGAALNQLVFSATQAETMIARIQNSIPQNQVQSVLGCSKTHVEQLVKGGLISSVVSMAEGGVGLTRGDFNLDDLSSFLETVCQGLEVINDEPEAFVDLSLAARGRSSTAEIIGWQLSGQLRRTGLLDGRKRLDCLRFCLAEIREIVDDTRGHDLHCLTSVAGMLGISLPVVKLLVSKVNGGPWLRLAPVKAARKLKGTAYVSSAEIEMFKEHYTTHGLICRALGINHRTVQKALEAIGVEPVIDPEWLGTMVYLRADVDARTSNLLLMRPQDATTKPGSASIVKTAMSCAKSSKGPI